MTKEFLSPVSLPANSVGVTASPGDNSTKLATTQYVDSAVAAGGGGGGGGVAWSKVSTNTTMTANNAYLVDVTGGAVDMTVPAVYAEGDEFIVHAYIGRANVLCAAGEILEVGSGNTLVVAEGETAHIVAVSSSVLRLV